MHLPISLTADKLPSFLLNVAIKRAVFIWGQPGIGKSACVEQFAEALGMDCVSLLGTQLAPEDLMGVPQIKDGKTVFHPPGMIARDEPYVLFCDELNGASHDIQKAFYSLIHEHRIGEYHLPEGSVVIGAGNRSEDSAIVRPMSSALVNRMVHVQLRPDYKAWLKWARINNVHPLVLNYLSSRPSHLTSKPPKTEAPYSTPRSWHMLSDVLYSYSEDELDKETVKTLAYGMLTSDHATQFAAFSQIKDHHQMLNQLIKGEIGWPQDKKESDQLYFLAHALRDQLIKELPEKAGDKTSDSARELAHRSKRLLVELAEINEELTKAVVVSNEDGKDLPDWYLLEVSRDIPSLLEKRKK